MSTDGVHLSPFHLAIAVTDLDLACRFYVGTLGCTQGRSAERWVDFDLFGHQLSVHLRDDVGPSISNPVDGDDVAVPHFGVILVWQDWHALAERLRAAKVQFVIAPKIRFEGQVGEQATMFLRDPAGNALEFKSFRDPSQVFAS
jgi:extradiol dioxygenase family protein